MELIGPGSAAYDAARAVFDARVDRRPAVIARCSGPDDVAAAVGLARERGLPVAVRCGGTSSESVADGGLVVDVSPMKDVSIDVAARTVRVGAGVTWGELDAATQEHGLAVPGARISRLGVAGVALGSEGSGWFERSLGTTAENVVGVARTAGVATSLALRLHAVGPELLCGFLGFRRERALDVARAYRDYVVSAPEEVGGGLLLFAGRGGACQVVFCHRGSVGDGERAVAPLRALGPSLDAVAVNEYRAFQAMSDLQHPVGVRAERRVCVVAELDDATLEAIVAAADRPAAALSHVLLRPRPGGLGTWTCECIAMWPPVPSLDAAHVGWVADVLEAAALSSRAVRR